MVQVSSFCKQRAGEGIGLFELVSSCKLRRKSDVDLHSCNQGKFGSFLLPYKSTPASSWQWRAFGALWTASPFLHLVLCKTNIRISADGIGSISGRLLVGTAELISPSELIDTTGAGDAFIGAILYALCAGMPAEKMLPFASQVAAAGCRALGARSGLPWHTDPRLAPFLASSNKNSNLLT
ncbi:hypothetical protein KFK09_018679 [Dendrobium nobile]|uniref:Carbohydrate kinase PfkB domain-containing protein n=1 Tax=Dendrobium nobile TaxID=94219 RepID=A0A8T3AV15_DENNO|nr:hypothetical protein KFK09_018679 [Dendrobium nobile]